MPARRARGSIASIAALALVVAVAALGVLDVANFYLARRSLQNVADLAALAAVQQMDDACQQPPITAAANAASNGFTVSSTQTLSTVCGRWDSSGSGMAFTQASNPPTAAQLPLNGAEVTVTRLVPYFFVGPAHEVSAVATAQATNTDSFSLSTTLVQADLLNGLLSGLLGTSVNLSLASWSGLANTTISLGDLVAQANAGTVDGLLNTNVTVAQLAQLMANVLQKQAVTDANASAALGALNTILSANIPGTTSFALGNRPNAPGLLSLGLADSNAALDATISPLQALIVGAEIAQTGQPPIGLNVNLNNLTGGLGTLPASLQLAVQIVEPPSIGVGQPGYIPGTTTWRTVASTAQILVLLNVGLGTSSLTVNIPILGSLINFLTQAVDVSVQLPVYLTVAPAQAWLTSIQCAPTAAASVINIGAQTGLLNLCIGQAPTGLNSTQAFSCGTPATIANVALAGQPVATVTAALPLEASVPAADAVTLSFDGNGNPLGSNSTNANQLGPLLSATLSDTSQALLQGNALNVSLLGSQSIPAGPLVGFVGSVLTTLLTPVLDTLSTALIAPLLQLLGVQVGVATVTPSPAVCGVAQLVK
ncbi:TadG family pilus assembly protein [Paraburkholderia sp. B3]|uniref:pilus assembly protein TadG-related protein n=1 Tax=Paraburkholderia sp. B3 TaxID=3134791 RepID=UPI0039826BFF